MTLIISYYNLNCISRSSHLIFLVLLILCLLGTTTTDSKSLENGAPPVENSVREQQQLHHLQYGEYANIVERNLFDYFTQNDNKIERKRYNVVADLKAKNSNPKTDLARSLTYLLLNRKRRDVIDEEDEIEEDEDVQTRFLIKSTAAPQTPVTTFTPFPTKDVLNFTTQLDLSKRNLTRLNYANNFKNVQHLKHVILLNVSSNLLSTLDTNSLSNLTNLQIFDASHNLLTEFLFNHTSDTFSELNLSENLLENFFLNATKLTNHENLLSINLSFNKFNNTNQIVFYDVTNLRNFDLCCNQLVKIDREFFENLTNLVTLNLSCNRLSILSRNLFYHVKNLEILNLSNNNISIIDNNTFTNLPILKYLDLSFNNIFVSSVRALQGIPDLIGLSIKRNHLLVDSLPGFVVSWSLKELDLSDIGLCEVPFALAQSVRILNLRNNFINVSKNS